jgi:arylsulfatase A-like enzyme
MKKKPNILFFFTDDQRFDTITALGNEEISTPNIDKLVARGTCFTHAHIPCGTSGAVCMPSRAMLNTGRTLFHIQDAGQEIPESHTLIGEALQREGYYTWGTGKWHNGPKAFNRSFKNGAEILFGGMADHWNVPVYNYDPSGKYETICPIVPDPMWSNEVIERHCDHVTAGLHSSEMVCGAAIDFLENYDSEEPFYQYIAFLAPHDPRTMPKRFKDMYDPEKITLPANFMGGHPFDTGALRIRDEELAVFPRSPDETKRHLAEYYGMISHLDDELGKVVKTLEKKGLLEDTIIVFAGDNGLALGQHGLFGKQNCYDHSVRVPLIFAGPGVPENQRSDALVYLLDIFPTLCELTGTEIPDSVEGKSMVKAMHNPELPVRDELYFAYCDFQRAVRHEQYKLIEYVVEGKHIMTQFFDLESDPMELDNLAGKEEFSQVLNKMRERLFRLRDEWDDIQSPWGKTFWEGYNS